MDWLLRTVDRTFGVPPPEVVQRYVGPWDGCYLGYAAREEIRARAASGGVVSALLVHLLEQGIIQGALISRVLVEEGRIQARPTVARSREDVLQGQSSIYMEFPWLRQALSLLRAEEGDLAVVGLPCQIHRLRRVEARDPELARKVRVHVALVCGRSSSKDLLLKVLARKGIREEDVADIRFREGHWRGRMHVWLRDGSEAVFPFGDFSLYRNLHFHCETRCLACEDPLGEHADVACGDAWLHELKGEPIKHSLVISRQPQVTGWMREMERGGDLVGSWVSPTLVFKAQRRGLIPAKRGKRAKAALGRLFGYRMADRGAWRSHWNDYLVAAMVLFNARWARSPALGPLIFSIPRPLLRLVLALMSLLKNF